MKRTRKLILLSLAFMLVLMMLPVANQEFVGDRMLIADFAPAGVTHSHIVYPDYWHFHVGYMTPGVGVKLVVEKNVGFWNWDMLCEAHWRASTINNYLPLTSVAVNWGLDQPVDEPLIAHWLVGDSHRNYLGSRTSGGQHNYLHQVMGALQPATTWYPVHTIEFTDGWGFPDFWQSSYHIDIPYLYIMHQH